MCGKNGIKIRKRDNAIGSPPRVREKLRKPEDYKTVMGDHPRVCGKNLLLFLILRQAMGSPPRVREKLAAGTPSTGEIRITPACAGKTLYDYDRLAHAKDHPRVCGKNLQQERQVQARLGSPPRVREKPVVLTQQTSVYGITPACAGKTIYNLRHLW